MDIIAMSTRFWLFYLLTLTLIGGGYGKNSYILTAPNVVRPGRDYIIHGELLGNPSGPVTIAAQLKDGSNPVGRAEVTVTGAKGVRLNVPVPSEFTLTSSGGSDLTLELTGSGALTFSETKSVPFEKKSTSIFIQTDKAKYKPGQTVNFRVFGVTPNLKIVYDKLKVELFDPKGNKINQWDVSGTELTSKGGVYVQQQVMSEAPVLGQWKLKAKLLSYGSDFEEKTFEVDEYVLPKFEVELDLPTFGRLDVVDFKGKIKAKYTFGKPVKGIADLRIKPKNERFEWINGSRQSVSKSIEMKMPITGESEFTVPVTRLKEVQQFLSGSSLIFEANVTEDLTKFKLSDDQELTFYDQPLKLTFPKSLPDTFKPGMTYDAVVIVAQHDDTPPPSVGSNLRVTITEYRKTKANSRPDPNIVRKNFSEFRRFWRPPPDPIDLEVSNERPVMLYTIPADGIVAFSIDTTTDVTKLDIKAEYEGISGTQTLKKRHSPSDTYLQMRLLTNKPQTGNPIDIDIRSSQKPDTLNYQIYSRGTSVDSGTIPMSSLRKTWSLNATAAMAPRAKIVVFFVRSDGEVIADALTITVEGIFENKVDVHFNQTVAAPNDKIQLEISADVGSDVHLLGVDKSVLLLATGNDITESKVLQELQGYDIKSRKSSSSSSPILCDWFCWRWPISVGGEDVKDVFDEAGVLVFTDALVYEHIERPRGHGWQRRKKIMKTTFLASDGSSDNFWRESDNFWREEQQMVGSSSGNNPDPVFVATHELKEVTKIRKQFPETWVWSSVSIPSSGKISVEETVPDTITSWIATAFAVSPNTGLGVAAPSPQLTVSMPFFVSVVLPYSVVRGEKVILQVNIHNYSPQSLYTYVKLEKNEDFENILIDGATQSASSVDVTRIVTVGVDEIAAVYFPIVVRKIGLVDIKVQAQTKLMADAVHKKLLVEAEGSPREYNLPMLIDLKSAGTVSKTVNVEYPLRTVSGSERVRATVIGDLMGPSIKGLDKLIKLPTGCGEQNMLNFAPNIFVVKYLEATKTLEPDIFKTAKDFMETGYQKELTYAHPDGSFSAFGKSDKSGSTWLTAFVLKSFVQAKPYIFVDDVVINKAIDWLIQQQNSDGTFNEPGRVIHKEMQGGSTSGNVSLTSYVLIALLEARAVEGVANKISTAQTKALTYLESQVSQLTEVYDLAIVAYTLQLAGSPKAAEAWEKLDSKSKTESGMKYWQKNPKSTADVKPWQKRNGVAEDIELTSYALLTLANKKDRVLGVQVLKWVAEQRNEDGGFSSTQDTVMALQGLAEMAALIYSPTHDLTVTIAGTGFSDQLKIDSTNAQVLQTRDLPRDVGAVTITATGTGLGLVQIEVSYNIDDDGQKQSFQLSVTVPRETLNDFDVKACARWLDEGVSSMAVLEIGSPSGFTPDVVGVFSEPDYKKIEIDSKKLVLYFDEIGARETCATVTMHRTGLIAGAQPVAVRVYDYYEPSKQVTEFYLPETVRNSEVCEVCGKECDFCRPA